MVVKYYKKDRGRKKKFSKAFKEHLRIGLTAATGFIIAFAWREPLIIFVNDFILKYLESSAKLQVGIISALVISFFGVLFIWFLSRILK